MESPIYNKEGKEVGKIALPEKIFAVRFNPDVVHQVITSLQTNMRTPVAHTKDRGDVRGGGKKPWRQKGTGRARHGSIRSPIWVGGGVSHGPTKEKNFSRKVNKKMGAKALSMILSAKYKDGEIIFVDDLGLATPKTKQAALVLSSLASAGFSKISYKKGNRALVLTPAKAEAVKKSFRNITSAEVTEARNINPLLALSYKYLVFVNPEESVKILESRLQ